MLMLINLCEKEVMGRRSGPVRRTVRKYNSLLSREVAALFGLEGRTADGPPLGCGQSAPGVRTVRRCFKEFV